MRHHGTVALAEGLEQQDTPTAPAPRHRRPRGGVEADVFQMRLFSVRLGEQVTYTSTRRSRSHPIASCRNTSQNTVQGTAAAMTATSPVNTSAATMDALIPRSYGPLSKVRANRYR
jgi:hypothetical protein